MYFSFTRTLVTPSTISMLLLKKLSCGRSPQPTWSVSAGRPRSSPALCPLLSWPYHPHGSSAPRFSQGWSTPLVLQHIAANHHPWGLPSGCWTKLLHLHAVPVRPFPTSIHVQHQDDLLGLLKHPSHKPPSSSIVSVGSELEPIS